MITQLLDAVSDVVADFSGVLGDTFSNVGQLFFTYDSATNSLSLTFLGTIGVIAVGAGLIWLVYRLIKGAIRGIGR